MTKGYAMVIMHDKVLKLIKYVKIDRFSVECHFRCQESGQEVVSHVAFEPYDGKIELSWRDIVLHPIESYNRYYHTPITIYGNDTDETIVAKAFEKVAQHFVWNNEKQEYVCKR